MKNVVLCVFSQVWCKKIGKKTTNLFAEDRVIILASFGEVVSFIYIEAAVYFNGSWSTFWVGVFRSCLTTRSGSGRSSTNWRLKNKRQNSKLLKPNCFRRNKKKMLITYLEESKHFSPSPQEPSLLSSFFKEAIFTLLLRRAEEDGFTLICNYDFSEYGLSIKCSYLLNDRRMLYAE